MELTNSYYISELREKLREDKLRHHIIFLDTMIGAANAISKTPEDLMGKRQIARQYLEAESIKNQRKSTIQKLEESSIDEVFDKLKNEYSNFSNEEFLEHSFLKYNQCFKAYEVQKKIGNRLEKTLRYKDARQILIEENHTGERKTAKLLMYERDKIKEILKTMYILYKDQI